MKNIFLLLIGLIFIGGSVYLFLGQPITPSPSEIPAEEQAPLPSEGSTEVQIGEIAILAEIADTPAKRQQGLSGREALEPGQGMLFVFDETKPHGIWMKDMLMSIDIVWLNAEKQVIWIESEVSPDTYPQIFVPPSPSSYVLELPSGFSAASGIEIGDQANFKHK